MQNATIVGTWHINGKDFVCYGSGLKAEHCEVDLRSPVLKELKAWLQSSNLSCKEVAKKVGLPQWAIKGIMRGNCQLPTATLYEIRADLISNKK